MEINSKRNGEDSTVAQKCHGNFNLFTAVSILLTAISISRAISPKCIVKSRLFQGPITRSEQLPCVVVTHFPFVSISFFSICVENRFCFLNYLLLFPLFLKTQIINGDKIHIVYSQERFWLHPKLRHVHWSWLLECLLAYLTSLFCTMSILGAECALVEGCAKFTLRATFLQLDLAYWSFLSLIESLMLSYGI